MTNTMKKAVLYARFSSENQRKGKSIQYQVQQISAFAKRKGYTIVGRYVDEAKTGLDGDRPMFQKLMNDSMDSPPWDTVLVYNFSRFFRDDVMSKISKECLRDQGIKVVSITETLDDGATPSNIEPFLDMMNEQQSKNNGKHTHSAMKLKAKDALHCGGKPPLGYDVNPETKKLEINPLEAECVRRIYQLFLADYSYSQMAETLNKEGYCTKFGRSFNKNSFDMILQQRKYIGDFVWNKAVAVKHAKYGWNDGIVLVESKAFRKRWEFKDGKEWVIVPGGVPAIISLEDFEKVQKKLESRKRRNANQMVQNRRSYFLGGKRFLVCGNCGSCMTGNVHTGNKGTTISYKCPHHKKPYHCSTKSFTAKNLDFFVASLVVLCLLKESNLEKINQFLAEEKPLRKSRKLQGEITGLQNKIHHLSKMIGEGYEELSDELRRVTLQKKCLEEQKNSLKKMTTKVLPEDIKMLRKRLRKYILNNDTPEVRELLTTVIENVTIDDEMVSITLHTA